MNEQKKQGSDSPTPANGIYLAENTPDFTVRKTSKNCLVIETEKWFYKIRKIFKTDYRYPFHKVILQAITAEYQAMGLEWDLFEIATKTSRYCIEKRQKLRVVEPSDCPFDNVLEKNQTIKRNIETRLEFPFINAQIRQSNKFEYVEKIVLASDAENNYDDYAFCDDGNIVMLGTSNIFLALLNHLGEWDKSSTTLEPLRITLESGNYYLEDYRLLNKKKFIEDVINPTGKHWLFPVDSGDIAKTKAYFVKEFDEHLLKNVAILANKRLTQVKTTDDYGSYTEEIKKLGGDITHILENNQNKQTR